MANSLKGYLYKQNFNPDFLGLLINPFFFARKGLYDNIKKYSPEISGHVLDVGCGKKPYRKLFRVNEYIGMDIENPGHDHSNEDIDIYYDGKTFPFIAEKFDAVITSEVFEHVFDPDLFLREIHRVLKTEGKLLLTVPFVWDEHEQPNDYARYSSFGIRHALEVHGFQVVSLSKSAAGLKVVFQLFNLYIYKRLFTKNRILNALLTLALLAPFNILGLILSACLPSGKDLYISNIVLAKKL
jgi:SAM-dependent methyltransferase